MSKLRISLLIVWVVIFTNKTIAQSTDYAYKADSTVNKWGPTAVRIGVDIAGPIYGFIQHAKYSYEGSIDVDFNRFFGVIEIGNAEFSSINDATSYSSLGTFYRFGIDANFIPRDPNLNVFFFGIRYAKATFDEKLKGEYKDIGWGIQRIEVEQYNSSANWVEMNIGMRVRIWKSFFTGYSLKFKFLRHNTFNKANFESYFIPGYGLSEKLNNWSLNYYVQYRFAWKKKPINWRSE